MCIKVFNCLNDKVLFTFKLDDCLYSVLPKTKVGIWLLSSEGVTDRILRIFHGEFVSFRDDNVS